MLPVVSSHADIGQAPYALKKKIAFTIVGIALSFFVAGLIVEAGTRWALPECKRQFIAC